MNATILALTTVSLLAIAGCDQPESTTEMQTDVAEAQREGQAEIRDAEGGFVARVDFLFKEQRTVVEFDGLAKYAERSDLIREKAREDALRALGYSVVRITWVDLAKPMLADMSQTPAE